MYSRTSSPQPSRVSLNHTQSQHSRTNPSGSTLRTVITSPPWAKDEPESPVLEDLPIGSERSPRPSAVSMSHAPSVVSDRPSTPADTLKGYHRWTFALPTTRPKSKRARSSASSSDEEEADFVRERQSQAGPFRPSRPRWPTARKQRSGHEEQSGINQDKLAPARSRSSTLRLQIPLPAPRGPFTVSHTKTPGWDSPWTPRVPARARIHGSSDPELGEMPSRGSSDRSKEELREAGSQQTNRTFRKRFRNYVLTNNYVPLVSRIINIAFTTTALAIAIRIRELEQRFHLLGAVGSSPFLAIIFAPATLVHVMIAIYLEYFGRPLGLWQTSRKLAHTLLETAFICLWSAQLALSFDNYMTSPLHCTPQSSISWYSQLPASPSIIGSDASPELQRAADRICDYQRTLAGVAMVSLVFYVTNLVISLYRIFQKVKVHQGWGYSLG
ncbi:hypothetical protein M422DRAFT_67409 [Sphaerobolus stellatus SS14]|uniref:Uncharacterized protein n=1 Tax=Sphaerobolus stellatus (strain SS14) TaxID=990650 RepID=A0A0C9VS45_SPHS4|nr:hypothetical protein M422DRAFT_67409 [Sphaerobolus stellatus SS14]